MVKLIGRTKINCAVFISGRGTNLKSIFKYSKTIKSKIDLKLVISNNYNILGVEFAKKNKINTKIIDYKKLKHAEDHIIKHLRKYNIKLICLAGFMKILSNDFIKKFKYHIINIHPSLLPKYKGLNTHERAINNGEKYSGCTVHFVTEKLDSGKIILQDRVKIFKSDNPQTLAKKILILENKIYPKAIDLILSKI